jgi:hypothetical protein
VREYGYVLHTRVVGGGPDALFPQTGIRFHAGARGSVTESEITGNTFTADPRQSAGILLTDAETGPDPSNPAIRAFSARANAITGNGFGLFNANITNTAERLGAPASAPDGWWGCAAGPGSAGCDPVSGPDSAAAPTVELGTVLTAAPAALTVPGATPDAAPTGSFVDPAEGEDVAVGQTVTPTVLAQDDFGVKSVAVTLDGAPFATDGVAPYELSWTPTYADLGATHTFVATITDSSGQTVTATRHLDVPVPAGYKAVTLNPLSWDAGTILVGFESTRTFTLTNTGQNPVALGTVASTGDASFTVVPGADTCMASTTLAVGATCTIDVRFAPTVEGPVTGTLSVAYAAPGAASPIVATLAGNGHVFSTTVPHDVGGTVVPTLGLTVSSPTSSLGTFVPGVAADYTSSVAIGVTSSTADASLSIQDPSTFHTSHLVNGTFALASPLQAKAGSGTFAAIGSAASPLLLQTFAVPGVDVPTTVTFKQSIAATEPLRTGTYAKTVLFTLSTNSP